MLGSLSDTAALNQVLKEAVEATIQAFSDCELQANELCVSLVEMSDSTQLKWAGYRDEEPTPAASVIKLFYAIAAYHWLERGQIQATAEFNRAMKDMIVDSSNDATGYIVDLLTGTTSGPELADSEMSIWSEKRNVVNEFFHGLGYQNINVNQKPWGDGPFGRERIFVGADYENRNILTTRATAKLMTNIVLGKAAAPHYCKELLAYMHRDRSCPPVDKDDQAHGFIGSILPPGTALWSKAGWTSTVRHDSLYAELEKGPKLCLVVFTRNHSQQPEILPALGGYILSMMHAVTSA